MHRKQIIYGGLIAFLLLSGVLSFLHYSFTTRPEASPILGSGPAATLRQEINIVDAPLYAPSGSYATSSGIINIDPLKYSGTVSYYFEVVASTTGATNAGVSLVSAATGASTTAVYITGGNSWALYRSAAFTPTAVATDYQVLLGKEAIGKGIKAARVVIIQSIAGTADSDATSTQTQIEIGAEQTFTGTATTSFAAPKYWTYSASKWDGTQTVYAEVTYEAINGVVASTSSYRSGGTYTINLPGGTASTSVGLWGGGGSGGGTINANEGGDSGAGGQFASSTLIATTTSHTLIVAATTVPGGTGLDGTQGATSTWDGTYVVAGGGMGGKSGQTTPSATSTGNTAGCVGQVCYKGGDGGPGGALYGCGGGGGAGSGGNGASITSQCVAGGATNVGGGAGGAKLTSAGTGNAGSQAGGGGGGGWSGNSSDRTGGTGAAGRADIANYIATTTIAVQEDDGAFGTWTDKAYIMTAASVGGGAPQRFRSSSFTPSDGKHYRIALRKQDTRTVIAVYNAKIIVDTTSSGGGAASIKDAAYISNSSSPIQGETGGSEFQAQSFQPTVDYTLTQIAIQTTKTNSPTDNLFIELHDGFGGSLLATSDSVSASSIPVAQSTTTITFSTTYTVTAGHTYAFYVKRDGVRDTTNFVSARVNLADDYANGFWQRSDSGSFTSFSPWDMVFETSGTTALTPFTKLEPQYLLAATSTDPGTSLQKTLSTFDPSEWSGVANTYLLDVDAGASSASDVVLKDSTGATTYATLNNPNNVGTTTLDCIPTTSTTWDTLLSTNNMDVWGVRVLAQVIIGGAGGTSACGSGGPTPYIRTDDLILFE